MGITSRTNSDEAVDTGNCQRLISRSFKAGNCFSIRNIRASLGILFNLIIGRTVFFINVKTVIVTARVRKHKRNGMGKSRIK